MHKKYDERLKMERTKLIYYIAIIQNFVLIAELLYERVSENKPLREVVNFGNPVALAFLVYFIPVLLITIIYGVKNNDENRIKQLPIIVGSVILTGMFAGGVFLIDGAISSNMALLILIVGIFFFLFSEFINFYREK